MRLGGALALASLLLAASSAANAQQQTPDIKELAAVLLNASDEQLADLLESGKYQEVQCDDRS